MRVTTKSCYAPLLCNRVPGTPTEDGEFENRQELTEIPPKFRYRDSHRGSTVTVIPESDPFTVSMSVETDGKLYKIIVPDGAPIAQPPETG